MTQLLVLPKTYVITGGHHEARCLASVAISLLLAGCSTPGSQSSPLDSDLNTIRSGYKERVDDLGADHPQCKGLADAVHSVAQQIGEAQNTAGRMKMEEQGRRSMGYQAAQVQPKAGIA